MGYSQRCGTEIDIEYPKRSEKSKHFKNQKIVTMNESIFKVNFIENQMKLVAMGESKRKKYTDENVSVIT